ncbi:MAG: hypothetical protein H8E27_00660 [Verrucomicrobia subdivision 3 bacterium]|nr:hypothetical protein [Limisphaerales bacterium]
MFDEIPDWVWWVAAIFAAGVIGQFGKSLTLKFLGLFSKDNTDPKVMSAIVTGKPAELGADFDMKQQKKIFKVEVKRAKKEIKSQAKSGG